MTSSSPKVWFITGCSSGFGASLTEEILTRGDKVIATARNIDKLSALKQAGADVMQLDVTSSLDTLKKLAEQAHGLHGRIDYLVNNAGFSMQGTIEERTPEETQAQFDTNVFGLLNVTRAFLPYMRAARSGVIANISSMGAWMSAPCFGLYNASKYAASGFSENLGDEVQEFGIKVCAVEPGAFRSNFLTPGNIKVDSSRISDYEGTTARKIREMLATADGTQPGDVRKGAKVMVDVLTESTGKPVPKRLVLGGDAYSVVMKKCEDTIKLLEEWKEIANSTDHDDVQKQ